MENDNMIPLELTDDELDVVAGGWSNSCGCGCARVDYSGGCGSRDRAVVQATGAPLSDPEGRLHAHLNLGQWR